MPGSQRDQAARSAVRRFVEAHHLYVRSIANKLAPDPSQADDLAHEAFLIAMRKADTFDPTRDVRAWLAGITRNVCRRAWRVAIRDRRLKRDALAEYMEQLADQPPELFPERALERLDHCLAKLSERGRTLLRLRYHLGLRSRQIAQEVASTADAVRMALVRIRGRLRTCLQQEPLSGGLAE